MLKILKIVKSTYEEDWRFYDCEAEVYEVHDEPKPGKCDCSVCRVGKKKPVEKIRIILPFREARLIIKNTPPHKLTS